MGVQIPQVEGTILEPHARSLPEFLHVAYGRGSVILRHRDEIPREGAILRVFFPIDNTWHLGPIQKRLNRSRRRLRL